jgi:hypothetical protein
MIGVREQLEQRAKDARWVPVRRGPIYCSPGCGNDCTWEAKLHADHKAKWLADVLADSWGGIWTRTCTRILDGIGLRSAITCAWSQRSLTVARARFSSSCAS